LVFTTFFPVYCFQALSTAESFYIFFICFNKLAVYSQQQLQQNSSQWKAQNHILYQK